MYKKALVVDDQEMIQRVVKLTLERVGFAVDQASDGEDGLAVFSAGKYDLVISDVKMPRMDGVELLRLIRERDKDVPVLMMSGYADPGTGKEIRELGAFDFLVKPFKPGDLIELCKSAVEG